MEPDEYAMLSDVLSLENGTAAEAHTAMLAFLEAHPEANTVLAKLVARLGEPEATLAAPDTARTFDMVLQRLRAQGLLGGDGESVGERVVPRVGGTAGRWRGGWGTQPLRQRLWYTVAGITMCILAVVLGGHIRMSRLGDHKHVPVSTYVTGNGERANITLPDGNTVTLNVASRLEVPADYLTGNHTLSLNGEALFIIRHRTGTPFTVIAGGDTTQVLGTTFVVRHYTGDSTAIVAVHEGKVAVHLGTADVVVLTAGRQMAISRTGAVRIREGESGQFSFATGVLTFMSTLFPNAIPDLDRWYDADIRLGDSTLVTQRLTGEFAAGSLSDLAVMLEGTYNVRVMRAGRVLTLYRK